MVASSFLRHSLTSIERMIWPKDALTGEGVEKYVSRGEWRRANALARLLC
jgi:hypothetical protein